MILIAIYLCLCFFLLLIICIVYFFFFFFFNDTAPPEISPLSLHDALPISLSRPALLPYRHHRQKADLRRRRPDHPRADRAGRSAPGLRRRRPLRPARHPPRLCPGHLSRLDRKSTRLNSSHLVISYAVFCLI